MSTNHVCYTVPRSVNTQVYADALFALRGETLLNLRDGKKRTN